jgi:hypothetical protein
MNCQIFIEPLGCLTRISVGPLQLQSYARTGYSARTPSSIQNIHEFGYRSGGPGSVPGTTRKIKVVGLEQGPLSLVSTTEELLDRKVAAPVYKTENTAVGIRHADHVSPSIRKKIGNHFADKRRSLGLYSSSLTQTMELFFSSPN